MDRSLTPYLKAALLCACVAFISLAVLGVKGYFVLTHADATGAVILGQIQHELDGNNKASLMHLTKKTVGETRNLIGHTSTLVGDERRRAEDQNREIMAVVRAGGKFIADTNASVNAPETGLVPQLANSLQQSTAGLTKVTDAAAVTIQHVDQNLAPVLASALQNSKNLEAVTGDPDLHTSFQKLSFDLGELGKMAQDGAAITGDVRGKVHSTLYPKKQGIPERILWFALSHGSQLSQIKLGWF